MDSTKFTSIEDLRQAYGRRVPRMFYDYCETGSYTGSTFIDNSAAFAKYRLRQRVARNIDNRKVATSLVGEKVAMPVALGPVGMTGMQHADGEILACRAAQNFGVPYTLTTMSICSIEEVAKHNPKPFWFQLYVMRDRGFASDLVARAKAAKCSALVLTLDLQLLGQRHKDIKNGLSAPPKLTLTNILNMLTKPRWCLGMLGTRNRQFGNIIGHVKGVKDMGTLSEWTHSQFDPTLDWDSVAFIRRQWGGKLILKGINDVDDALTASALGADAIIVSNHGGRQLDGAPATIDMLGPIVDAVGDRIEVLFDSGIRSGMDILKALALGAKGTMIGRAYVYGLGAGGEAGVTRALEILKGELDVAMGLCGERDIRSVGRHNLLMPSPPFVIPPPASARPKSRAPAKPRKPVG
ncbi:MAG: alpha-hydroxy-acid oxidizing protein [Alphaproteobacteria bacterium]|nr:alpha-hydroxy-acid oxidizing protein [Alphaproteobacteria bacterium]